MNPCGGIVLSQVSKSRPGAPRHSCMVRGGPPGRRYFDIRVTQGCALPALSYLQAFPQGTSEALCRENGECPIGPGRLHRKTEYPLGVIAVVCTAWNASSLKRAQQPQYRTCAADGAGSGLQMHRVRRAEREPSPAATKRPARWGLHVIADLSNLLPLRFCSGE